DGDRLAPDSDILVAAEVAAAAGHSKTRQSPPGRTMTALFTEATGSQKQSRSTSQASVGLELENVDVKILAGDGVLLEDGCAVSDQDGRQTFNSWTYEPDPHRQEGPIPTSEFDHRRHEGKLQAFLKNMEDEPQGVEAMVKFRRKVHKNKMSETKAKAVAIQKSMFGAMVVDNFDDSASNSRSLNPADPLFQPSNDPSTYR
ncbi:unnamed protein product, partial [Polarella glacialis]